MFIQVRDLLPDFSDARVPTNEEVDESLRQLSLLSEDDVVEAAFSILTRKKEEVPDDADHYLTSMFMSSLSGSKPLNLLESSDVFRKCPVIV